LCVLNIWLFILFMYLFVCFSFTANAITLCVDNSSSVLTKFTKNNDNNKEEKSTTFINLFEINNYLNITHSDTISPVIIDAWTEQLRCCNELADMEPNLTVCFIFV
jgi:hypothetical protein